MENPSGIKLRCSCGKKIRAHENLVGKKVRCPACRTILTVPSGKVKIVTPVNLPKLPETEEQPRVQVEQLAPPPVKGESVGSKSTAGQVIVGVINLLYGAGVTLMAGMIIFINIMAFVVNSRSHAMSMQVSQSNPMMAVLYIIGYGFSLFAGVYLAVAGIQALSLKHSRVRAASVIAFYGFLSSVLVMVGAIAVLGNGVRGAGFLFGLIVGLVYLAWPLLQVLLNRFVLFAPPKEKPRFLDRFHRQDRGRVDRICKPPFPVRG